MVGVSIKLCITGSTLITNENNIAENRRHVYYTQNNTIDDRFHIPFVSYVCNITYTVFYIKYITHRHELFSTVKYGIN